MPPSDIENKIMDIPLVSDSSVSLFEKKTEDSEISIDTDQRRIVTGRSSSADIMVNSRLFVVANGTVTAVTTNTEANLESIDLTGISWNVGKIIRVTTRGVYSNTDGTSTVTIRVGTGTEGSITVWNAITSTAGAVTTQPWEIRWIGVLTAIGSSGALEPQLMGTINNVNKDDLNTATVTFNTTGTRNLAVAAIWSATAAGNTISIRQFLLEILN